ncbi:hypothetical protein [Streptomyces cinnamoneus]|nr:hypothetical protein [Streptomyces cinnamoneus]
MALPHAYRTCTARRRPAPPPAPGVSLADACPSALADACPSALVSAR